MSDLIDTVQLQEIEDSLITLYEIYFDDTNTFYFYSGVEDDLSSITVEGNEYLAIPIQIEGIEFRNEGAQARPTLTVANIVNALKFDILDDDETSLYEELKELSGSGETFKNDDFLGKRIKIRRTFESKLSTNPLNEFPPQIFVLDRIISENSVLVSFELTSPFDVEGLKLPSRTVVGKYCPWKYRGAKDGIGGCTWDGPDYNINNEQETGNDVCAKTLEACKVRFHGSTYGGNQNVPLPFGGFPGTRKFK